jgi:tyrosyl-tRNA synthetase
LHLLASGGMSPPADPNEQLEGLLRGAAEVIPTDELLAKLRLGRPLRVKLGIDPSRPDLHLGHAVVLRKLRQFQELGHKAVLIIGDFTGRVGDPSGQSETRPFLTEEEIEANAKTYFDQAGLVLDVERAEIRHNSEWLAKLSMADVLKLTSSYTVARMLERDDFRTRYRENRPISVVEFLYPLMQAMDSVAIEADVEMGGTDQTFNLLVGRDVQKAYGQEPQVVFTMPLLEGTDGVRKMSKSFDNAVSLTDPPDEMFGKLMSISDELVVQYLRLLTHVEQPELESLASDVASGGAGAAAAKRRLAREIVDRYHGAGTGVEAEARFDRVHREREVPDDVHEVPVPAASIEGGRVWLPRLMVELGLAPSHAKARQLIQQGGVRLDGEPVPDPGLELDPGQLAGRVLQVGRRSFVRLKAPV